MALWRLGEEVGGVGGVGGLTNQFGPLHCNRTDDTDAPYCFRAGWLGFTPFGLTMLLLLMLPLCMAALLTHCLESACKDNHQARDAPRDAHSGHIAAFSLLGGCASCLWFIVPVTYYASAPFYQEDAWHMVLAVSIAATYPLSWHLSFIAIPTSAAPFLAPLLGLTPATLKVCHVRAAWATLFWGSLHAAGELIYLASQGMLDLFSLHPKSDDDSLTFKFGLALVLILLAHSTHARLRRHVSIAPSFRTIHRTFAVLLLLVASAHWWPFAIFLAPAVACAATGYVVDGSQRPEARQRNAPLALAAAIIATLAGIVSVWTLRQAWMLAHPSQYYTLPIHLFPPAALALAFVLARGSAMAVLSATWRTDLIDVTEVVTSHQRRSSRETPLLNPVSCAS